MMLVKSVICCVKVPLASIFNKSLQNGVFPDRMKKAKVIHLFKGGDQQEVSNYRPVSILPQFSKILEKIFYNRLVKFISKNNVIYESQYGFRQKHSTNLALMEMIENISTSFDKNMLTTGIFIDLKKAFDTINHSILLQKLTMYGVRGISFDWLTSYLSNRSQYVLYNKTESEDKPISCGIPQGSILGPILFILYINDLPNVSQKLKFILFADDTNVFYSGSSPRDINETMKSELGKMSTWFKVNKLSLNVTKTNYMIFKNKQNIDSFNIKIDGMEVARIKSAKFLGVLVDENLCWTDHINDVSRKIAKSNGIHIYKVKYLLNSEYLYTLYCSLVLPYLNYACEIWGNNYESRLNGIIILQKKDYSQCSKIRLSGSYISVVC